MVQLAKYVSMSTFFRDDADKENIVNAGLIRKLSRNEKVFVFDIDYTLYWNKNMAIDEVSAARDAFVRKSVEAAKMDPEQAAQQFDIELQKGTHFCEIFINYLGMTPDEFFNELDVFDYSKYISRDEKEAIWEVSTVCNEQCM